MKYLHSWCNYINTKAFLFVQCSFYCNYIIAAKIALFTKYGGTSCSRRINFPDWLNALLAISWSQLPRRTGGGRAVRLGGSSACAACGGCRRSASQHVKETCWNIYISWLLFVFVTCIALQGWGRALFCVTIGFPFIDPDPHRAQLTYLVYTTTTRQLAFLYVLHAIQLFLYFLENHSASQ